MHVFLLFGFVDQFVVSFLKKSM
eukprot:COSAG05_NODE_16906_length_336_cov_0.805907_1_plen_22_part_10